VHLDNAKTRVLVVDDDERIAAAVRRALVYDGYAVDVASDGLAALAQVRDAPPDLVILDLMLPGLDGLEVCRRLRADSTSDLPVLMLTARDATAERVRGLDVGATEAVHRALLEQRSQGTAILLISEDLDEVLALSDRIAVIYEGQIMGIVDAGNADVAHLGLMMAGTRANA